MRHRAPIIVLSLSILLGLQGCTITPPKPWSPHITEEQRAKIHAIEITVSEEFPRVTLDLPSKGPTSGAGRKAGKWSGNWAKAAGLVAMSGQGNAAILSLALAAAMLAVTPAVASAGAVYGAIEAPSAKSVESQETQVQVALQSAQLIRQLENQLLTRVREYTDLEAILPIQKTDDRSIHREEVPTTVRADRILRVQLHSIDLQGPFDVNPSLELHFNVGVTLVEDSDAPAQYTRSFQYVIGFRQLTEWTANDGKLFRESIDLGLARLAELIVDDLFLTYPFVHEHRGVHHGS
jgi:hypothetical protein